MEFFWLGSSFNVFYWAIPFKQVQTVYTNYLFFSVVFLLHLLNASLFWFLKQVSNLVDAEMLLYSTSEDTSLKLHMYDTESWSQRRSVQLNSLSLSSCVLRDLPNENIKAAVVGSWDNHIYVYSVECGRMQQQLVAHGKYGAM